MGNGAKAEQKRARKDNKENKAVSQLKTNEQAQSIQCDVCKQTFQRTSKKPVLQAHQDSKHAKDTFARCFPKFIE